MMITDNTDDPLFKKHVSIANKLNLDEETTRKAWESFQVATTNFILEGDASHWLGCAIFEACCTQRMQTISRNIVEGNCVSLTNLLRCCELSLPQFFNKIKHWADMANLQEHFKQKIYDLEGNFAVSHNTFKEFCPMFSLIFKNPTNMESTKQHRNRKQRGPCTPSKLFEFCWLLFVTVKGEDSSCSLDLVTSYYLLQACIDLAFKNAFLSDRRDLLNPTFVGLPNNWSHSDYKVPQEAPCIIDILCVKHKNMIVDAKYVKEYTWKLLIKNLFDMNVLHGHKEYFTDILNPNNFELNFKNIKKMYESLLLTKGNFDEKIFLAEYRRRLIIKENAINKGNIHIPKLLEADDCPATESSRMISYGENSQKAPDTPLTGRCYLGPKDQNEATPLSTATKTVTILHNLLDGWSPSVSETLGQIFQSCTLNPSETIEQIIKELGIKFCEKYTQQDSSSQLVQTDYVQKRLVLAETLFYKLLEKILQEEKKRIDISPLLAKNEFYECLFACCLEIVIFSYNSHRKFPWILNTLEISQFNFVRVIELVVRSEEHLSRDCVKHLNMIEETILESGIWKTESPLWDAIKQQSGEEIPKYEEIGLPKNMIYNDDYISNPGELGFFKHNTPGPSAVETFQSPLSQVKKQLFPSMKSTQNILQSVKQTATHIMVTDSEGNKKFIPLIESTVEPVMAVPSPVPESRPKKTGSLCIVLRKFYNLVGVRMEHLCNGLGIADVTVKRIIWTVFEYSIRNYPDLIRDRHLDQLLMCAVYIVYKVTDNDKTSYFGDIMKCYRNQPQAKSHIYRKVLIKRGEESDKSGEPSREDLIQFYNNVYVKYMKSFAYKFSKGSNQDKSIHMSPIPSIMSLMASPKQQITKNVFIKPYESPTAETAGKTYNYFFNRSASKDLKAINMGISGKRKLMDNFEKDRYDKKLAFDRKVQTLMEERRIQSGME